MARESGSAPSNTIESAAAARGEMTGPDRARLNVHGGGRRVRRVARLARGLRHGRGAAGRPRRGGGVVRELKGRAAAVAAARGSHHGRTSVLDIIYVPQRGLVYRAMVHDAAGDEVGAGCGEQVAREGSQNRC